MNKLITIITSYAYIFMTAGFLILTCGVFLMFQSKTLGSPKAIALSLGIVGIIVYIIGRIGVSLKRKK